MFLHISEFLFCHVYFSRPGGRCTCTFNCFIVFVLRPLLIFFDYNGDGTTKILYLGPLQSYWSAIPLSDGWSIIYKIGTLTILIYVMNPIKLMFLPRGV